MAQVVFDKCCTQWWPEDAVMKLGQSQRSASEDGFAAAQCLWKSNCLLWLVTL